MSRWSREVLNTSLSSFVRNRDPGILSTKIVSTKMAVSARAELASGFGSQHVHSHDMRFASLVFLFV